MLWQGKGEPVIVDDEYKILKKMYPFVIVRLIKKNNPGQTTKELVNFLIWLNAWENEEQNSNFEIAVMAIKDGIHYIRGRFKFTNLKVAGRADPYPEYSLMRQIAIVDSGQYLHTIYTGFPNEDWEAPFFKHLKKWWSNLSVVRS
jgi:hypothetical protein